MEEKEGVREAPSKVLIEAQTFLCDNCGGTLKYDIDSGKFRCASCRSEKDIEAVSDTVKEYDFSKYAELESRSVAFDGIAVAQCGNCGCEITFDGSEIATTCPMCSSTQVAAVKQSAGIPPEGIIPFRVDKEDAGQRFKKWVKSRWFAPNDFKKKCGEGSLKGMYLPFWTFDADAVAAYKGRGGHTRTVRDKDGHTRTETSWFHVSGMVEDSFDDVLVCASDKEKEIRGILPYNTVENTVPYSQSYLSGFHAELYTVKADTAFESAKKIMEARLNELAKREILSRYDRAEVHSLIAKYIDVTYKHLLLPVWGSAFGYSGKLYKYFINGETGKVSGQRPFSIPKILLTVAAGIIIAAVLWFLFNNK